MERTISGMMGKGSVNHNTRAFTAKNCYSLVYLNQNPQFFSKLNKVWDILI